MRAPTQENWASVRVLFLEAPRSCFNRSGPTTAPQTKIRACRIASPLSELRSASAAASCIFGDTKRIAQTTLKHITGARRYVMHVPHQSIRQIDSNSRPTRTKPVICSGVQAQACTASISPVAARRPESSTPRARTRLQDPIATMPSWS